MYYGKGKLFLVTQFGYNTKCHGRSNEWLTA